MYNETDPNFHTLKTKSRNFVVADKTPPQMDSLVQ